MNKLSRRKAKGSFFRNQIKRTSSTKNVRQRFLIVCEGNETEPNYFSGFRLSTVVVKTIGVGQDPVKIVERAIFERNSTTKSYYNYDQVWCVFDKDNTSDELFNKAIKVATEEDIHIAYSNSCFELWFLLHFEPVSNQYTPEEYKTRLTNIMQKKFGKKYDKTSENLYLDFLELQNNALVNSEKLLQIYNPITPSKDNPSTTVHKLVKELLKFAK